MAYYVPPV